MLMISAPASAWPMIDQTLMVRASCGVPNSGFRVRIWVNTTGSAAKPISTPVTIRSAVPREWVVSPISSCERGSTKKK